MFCVFAMFMDISRSLPLSHSPLVVDEHAAALKPVCCWSAFVFVCRNLVIGGDAKPSTTVCSHIWWPWVFDVATSFLVTSCSALLHVMILGVRRVSLLPLPLQNRWEMQQVITMCCLALLPISFTTVCMSPFSTYIDSSSPKLLSLAQHASHGVTLSSRTQLLGGTAIAGCIVPHFIAAFTLYSSTPSNPLMLRFVSSSLVRLCTCFRNSSEAFTSLQV